jgi:hypothetical protein
VAGEQSAAGNREILFAALAAEAERAIRTAGFVGFYRTAGWANRGPVGVGPADHLEGGFGFPVSHAEDLSEAQGLCRFAEEEVLGRCYLTNTIANEYDRFDRLSTYQHLSIIFVRSRIR